jgi:hypothetical protein
MRSEVALWKRIESGAIESNVETGLKTHCASRREVIAKSRKQLFQRPKAAGEQNMRVSALRNARALCGTLGNVVAIQNDDLRKVAG